MGSIKNILITALSTLAVVLGTALFILWKLFMHEKELENAHTFMQSAPRREREEVLEAFSAKRQTYDETVRALRDEVEKETKREVIDGFKKAFGVRPDISDDDVTGFDAHLRGDK
jgi:hypothetical protein